MRKKRKNKYCVDCGIEITDPDNFRCEECSQIYYLPYFSRSLDNGNHRTPKLIPEY